MSTPPLGKLGSNVQLCGYWLETVPERGEGAIFMRLVQCAYNMTFTFVQVLKTLRFYVHN